MVLLYFIIFAIVAMVMLHSTNRSDDPWPGVTAAGCFAIGMLWPVLLPIVILGIVMRCIQEVLL